METRRTIAFDTSPATSSHLPHVTLPMIADLFGQEAFIYTPSPRSDKPRTIRWLHVHDTDSASFSNDSAIDLAHCIHFCHIQQAEKVLANFPLATALVVDDPDTDATPLVERYGDRVLIMQSRNDATYERLAIRLYAYFQKHLAWESELDHLAAQGASLGALLEVGETLLENFMFVTDSDLNVIAYTTNLEPPDALHRSIVHDGCLTIRDLDEQRYRLPKATFYVKESSDNSPFPKLSLPVHLSDSYFCSVSMTCCTRPLTQGLRDSFELFVYRIMPVLQNLWRKQAETESPHSFFLEKLLDATSVEKSYAQAQLDALHIPAESHFKAIAIETDKDVDPEKARRVLHRIRRINRGRVLCSPYRNVIAVLLYAPPSDAELSHRRIAQELEEKICTPCHTLCGSSELFFDVADYSLAFRQACYALQFRNAVQHERETTPSENGTDLASETVYLFGDVFPYFLIASPVSDERFLNFCFEHSLTQKLREEDRRNNTNVLQILWVYLRYERNATKTAETLHMHRNTVLYHIEKIQKRFDFDLSWHSARERLTLEFKALFLQEAQNDAEESPKLD